jgi:hypothetical protein
VQKYLKNLRIPSVITIAEGSCILSESSDLHTFESSFDLHMYMHPYIKKACEGTQEVSIVLSPFQEGQNVCT